MASLPNPESVPTRENRKPHVLIAGAGIGGLFLAILLDRAEITYDIFERSTEFKTVGSAMGLNANILSALEQLALLEEFKQFALPCTHLDILDGNLGSIATMDSGNLNELVGYDFWIFSRVDFLRFLQSKVPAQRIHLGNTIRSIEQNTEEVVIFCEDGMTYSGDVLVGADGAYSTVRQSLFESLQCLNGILAPSDLKEINKGYSCLVGTTNPLDPKLYPEVDNRTRSDHVQILVEGTPYSMTIFNVTGNRLAYMVTCQFDMMTESPDEHASDSEWGTTGKRNTKEEMMAEIKGFKVPYGGAERIVLVQDLFDETPLESISHVYLEDKLFETWTFGRTVLIGDAAHKLLPAGGQGAVCAMQDAVVLANCLYDLESLDHAHIKAALKDYRDQRYGQVKIQVTNSYINSMLLHGQTLFERVLRQTLFKWMPQSLKNKALIKDASNRPHAVFLPPPPKRGSGYVQFQRPSKRYEEKQRRKKAEQMASVAEQ